MVTELVGEPDVPGGAGVPVSSANAVGAITSPVMANAAAAALVRRRKWMVFMLSPVVTTVSGRPWRASARPIVAAAMRSGDRAVMDVTP